MFRPIPTPTPSPSTRARPRPRLAPALLLLALLLAPLPLQAQPVEDSVRAVVQELFDAMAAGDADRAAAVLLPEGQLVVHRFLPDGSATTGVTPHRDFLASLARAAEPWNERFWDSEVRVSGALASLWTPYDFHRGETFSHCGTEVFELLRIDGAWTIVGGTYTVETTGCPASPLGPLGSGG